MNDSAHESLGPWLVPALILHGIGLLVTDYYDLGIITLTPHAPEEPQVLFASASTTQASPPEEHNFFILPQEASRFGAPEPSETEHPSAQQAAAPDTKPTPSKPDTPPAEQQALTKQPEEQSSLPDQPPSPDLSPTLQTPTALTELSERTQEIVKRIMKAPTPVAAVPSTPPPKPAPAKSPLTLSRLARGFLDYVKESNGEVDINTQDMRFAEYNRQLGWALQNSFRLNNRPLTLESDIRTSITLHLEINEKGSLEHCSLTPEIDSSLQNLLLKIVRGAYPMPPLPAHHTASNTLHIKIPIEIAACKGTHSYYFVFRGA